jgi:hypothetical protein
LIVIPMALLSAYLLLGKSLIPVTSTIHPKLGQSGT